MKYQITIQRCLAWMGLLCILLASCNEDKGNYDYEVIDKVTEIGNIQSAYSVELGEHLQITPELETSLGNPDNFDYTWYYQKSKSVWEMLQEGKDLDFVIASPIGSPNTTYTCAFEAKNKTTGVAYRQTFSVRVAGTFNQGFVIAYEKENEFDLGMLVLNVQNRYDTKYDILASTAPDLQREGVKPYGIYIFNDPSAPHPYHTDGSKRSFYLLTDHYTTRLKVADFTWDESYDISNMVENGSTLDDNYVSAGKPIIAEQMKIGRFIANTSQYPHVYIYVREEDGSGNWYQNNTYPAWYLFSYPMNGYREDDGKRFEPAPYLACAARSTVFFDAEQNKFRFQQTYVSGASYGSFFFYTEKITDESSDHSFSFNDENEGLFYMSDRYTALGDQTSFALLKQKDGTLKFIEFSLGRDVTSLVSNDSKLRVCTFDASTNIGKAKFIAAAPKPNNAFVYYATEDNRVFYADITGKDAVEREITDQVITDDGYNEITAFKFLIPSTGSKNIAIATYNNSLGKDKGGKLSFYSIPQASSGNLSLATHNIDDEEKIDMSWTGFGKIVDLDYKQP